MLRFRLFAIAAAVLLSACAEWPPSASDAEKHFKKSRTSFERLAEKMQETGYWRVSLGFFGDQIEAIPASDMTQGRILIEDDPEWKTLFADTGMDMVIQSQATEVQFASAHLWGDAGHLNGVNGYLRSDNAMEDYVLCESQHKNVQCGRCAVPLEQDWYIFYVWRPAFYSADTYREYLNGKIAQEDYSKSFEEADLQCHNEGYKTMGYRFDETSGKWKP